MVVMRIAISGTPGCGKSTVSRKLSRKLDYELADLNEVIKKKKLYDKYDRKFKTYIVDVKKIENLKFPKDCIIDSHLSHFLRVDKVIVLRCDPRELEKRLKKKKWSKEKIRINVESEMIGIISHEAKKLHKKVFEVDTSGKTVDKTIKEIVKLLKNK